MNRKTFAIVITLIVFSMVAGAVYVLITPNPWALHEKMDAGGPADYDIGGRSN